METDITYLSLSPTTSVLSEDVTEAVSVVAAE